MRERHGLARPRAGDYQQGTGPEATVSVHETIVGRLALPRILCAQVIDLCRCPVRHTRS
jgi:hypothetical protein